MAAIRVDSSRKEINEERTTHLKRKKKDKIEFPSFEISEQTVLSPSEPKH